MEQVYYMIKGMIGELSEADQKEVNDTVEKVKVEFIESIKELTVEDYAAFVFTLSIFEIAKELDIPLQG